MEHIEIAGVSENNLKHIDVTIPKGKLVVFAGVSGSGKSSLVFDTIAVESNRQWQASYPMYLRNKMPHYERPKVDAIRNLTPSIVIDQKAISVNSRSTVGTAVDVAPLIRLLFSRIGNPSAGGSMAYSFNHPLGMCPNCTGLGEQFELDEDSLFCLDGTIRSGGLTFSQFQSTWQHDLYMSNPFLDPDKKLKDYSPEEWKMLRDGTQERLEVSFHHNSSGRTDTVEYDGIIPRFRRLYLNRDISKLKKSLQEEILTHVHKAPCKSCGGAGLNPKALASKINGQNIIDYFEKPVCELLPVLAEINNPVGASIARQISDYLKRMVDVGLGYLSLSRHTDTLSGGEIQRIKMVRNLGSSLSNITYIFDEPTAGLHPADAERIGRLLLALRDKHNNVLVVEHSRQMMSLADHIIELGEQAGENGGNIVYEGDLDGLLRADTITAQAIRQKIKVNSSPLHWIEGCSVAFEIRKNCI